MSLVLPSGSGVVPSANPVKGGLSILLTFGDGSTETVFWNGLGSQGQPLQPGNYVATLSQPEPGAGEVVKSEPFVLLGAKDGSADGMAASAMVVPNPVDGNWFTVQYQPDGGDTAVGTLYDLAGQRVAQATDAGSGSLRFSGDWGSGIYLLDFEVRDVTSGVLARRILKVAIVR
jgi:hypothetical protein